MTAWRICATSWVGEEAVDLTGGAGQAAGTRMAAVTPILPP